MFGFKIIKVQGHSMEPAIKAGSYVLARKTTDFAKGDIALFQTGPYPAMIKRISEVENDMYFLTGDNPNDSLDSRVFGWISAKDLYGKVIWY